MKTIALTILALILVGCKSQEPKVTCKYTVWVGTSAFASGYCTDSYKIENEMVYFKNKRNGKHKIVPRNSLNEIDINKIKEN